MKFRNGFVTNSSSSSYIVSCARIKDEEALRLFLEEEYGNMGKKVLNYIVSGMDVLNEKEELLNDSCYYFSADDFNSINAQEKYLFVNENIEGRPACGGAITYNVCCYNPACLEYVFSDTRVTSKNSFGAVKNNEKRSTFIVFDRYIRGF